MQLQRRTWMGHVHTFTAVRAAVLSALLTMLMPEMAHASRPGEAVKDGIFGTSDAESPSRRYSSGQDIGPWKVDSGDVEVCIDLFTVPHACGNSLHLNGKKPGAIKQTLQLEKGKTYKLSFLMSGDWRAHSSSDRSLVVELGSLKKTLKMNRPAEWSPTNMKWQTFEFTFDAKSSKETLVFKSESKKTGEYGPVIANISVRGDVDAPKSLDTIPVPLPKDLATYVQDKDKAILLGKALFWDMQVGSDGKTACASCHWHAGADIRTRNQLNPGAPGSAFGPQTPESERLAQEALSRFRGPNQDLTKDDFPFHRFSDPLRPGNNSHRSSGKNPVIFDTMEVVGSQGVVRKHFDAIVEGSPVDDGTTVADPVFNIDGTNVRQVTGRNAPTTVNAVFFDRSFWDGRANRYFNGVNPFGELDPDARVLKVSKSKKPTKKTVGKWVLKFFGMWCYWVYETETVEEYSTTLEPVRILIDNAALASQAVGPPNNSVEMSWDGREFRELGRKMLSLRPLALQQVAHDDSVLGPWCDAGGRGLDEQKAGYAKLIRESFQPEWWSGDVATDDGYTHMEANFSLFWGLSIMLYESTLVSDQTPYDRFARGDKKALSDKAQHGLYIFLNEGKCINCHGGPEFAGGTVSSLRGVLSDDGLIEFMAMEQNTAFYDGGFYNIGVRPQAEDLGVGASHPQFGPLSYTRQEQQGRNPDPKTKVKAKDRVAVDGAFKTPTLRNVELTGPYMHNGGMKNLSEVVEFYTRGADFRHINLQNLDPDVSGIPELQGNREGVEAVVEFMKHLTDPRVKYQKAPFDHPELIIPNGHSGIESGEALDNNFVLPAVGRNGGEPFGTFEEALESGL